MHTLALLWIFSFNDFFKPLKKLCFIIFLCFLFHWWYTRIWATDKRVFWQLLYFGNIRRETVLEYWVEKLCNKDTLHSQEGKLFFRCWKSTPSPENLFPSSCNIYMFLMCWYSDNPGLYWEQWILTGYFPKNPRKVQSKNEDK